MDANREMINCKWRQNAVTPLVHIRGRDPGSATPSVYEDSDTLALSDSPGPDGLAALSLEPPKRQTEVLGKIVPSHSKVKRLEKLTKQVKSPQKRRLLLPASHSIALKKKGRTSEEGSKAIFRTALIAAIHSARSVIPNTLTSMSPVKAEVHSSATCDRMVVNSNCSPPKPEDEPENRSTSQEDQWSLSYVFEDPEGHCDHSASRNVVLKGDESLKGSVTQVCLNNARGNMPEAESCNPSLTDLERIPELLTCFMTLGKGSQPGQSLSETTRGATTSSCTVLSPNGNTRAIQALAGHKGMSLSPSQRNHFVSFNPDDSPNSGPSKASRIKTEKSAGSSDPFALPLYSRKSVFGPCSNSNNTRRRSDTGSHLRCPPLFQSTFIPAKSPRRRLSEPLWSSHLDCGVGFVDTHCHLDMLYGKLGFRGTFSSFRELHQRSFPPQFRGCITNFCNPRVMVKEALWEGLLAEDMVWGAFGCHPHFAKDYSNVYERDILMAMRHPKAVAFGEMGLDYSHKNSTCVSKQKQVFERQLHLAVAMQKPLVIHCRDADDDLMEILRKCVPRDYKIHRHCFTNSYRLIEPFLAEFPNLYVGFTALITYLRATEARNALRRVPLDRIVLETDAPYFLPRQVNKAVCQFSHPGMGIFTLEELSLLKGEDMQTVLATVRNNTTQLYGI